MNQADDIVTCLRKAARDDMPPPATFAEWRTTFRAQADTFRCALESGARAGQLAFCFAAGYQAALRRMLPSLAPHAFAALLLSEGRRQRPEELLTVLTPAGAGRWRLEGEKSYVTGADAADPLLVVARTATGADGRVGAALLAVPPGIPGVVVEPRGDAGFLAALPHGRARFVAVEITADMLLPGDGWRDHARPFRTLEDVHVSTAIAAHLAVQALRLATAPPTLLASLVAALARLGECAARAPDDPVGHLLLAAADRELAVAATDIDALAGATDDAFARDWRANRMLLGLALPARQKRLEKAVATLRADDR